MSQILDQLNDRQKEAVQCVDGPLIVLAGAGSGKTKTLISRIAFLIKNGVPPASILAVTFTNKAAAEMKHRVSLLLADQGMLGGRFAQPWMGFSPYAPEVSTFHSFCVKLLRTESHALGLARPFVIYDDGDQLSLIKKIADELNVSNKLASPKRLQAAINAAKCQAIGPSELEEQEFFGAFGEVLRKVYTRYEEMLRISCAFDFGDLIVQAYRLLKANPQILNSYQERFRYLLVDEYQDTNRAQYLLITLLAGKYKNICVVGDEDQSIYKWRGADIRNILDFQKDYPNAAMIKLEQNYRSTKTIINAAAAVIRHNQGRYDKTLWTANEAGEKIRWATLADERQEAEFVATEIKKYLQKYGNLSFDDVAIFYRSHAQSRALEEQLRRHKVPYKIVGGVGFYERKEIKDVMAYLRVLVNPDDNVSLVRIVNVPTRGIGNSSIERLEEWAREKNVSLFEALKAVTRGECTSLGPSAAKKIVEFCRLLQNLMDLSTREPVSEIYHRLLDSTGYVADLKADEGDEAAARIENLEEFATVIQFFEEEAKAMGLGPEQGQLANFLAQVTLESAILEKDDSEQSKLSMMTLHSSKGLEFPLVFLVGCEEGLFPSRQAIDDADLEDSAIEEERRLAYVGLTRAKKFLLVTNAQMRRIYGQVQLSAASRFLKEIPPEYIQKEGKVGGMSAAAPHWWTESSQGSNYTASKSASSYRYDYSESDDVVKNVVKKATVAQTGQEIHIGQRVKHATYGLGQIKQLEGSESDRKVTIEFSGRQVKKFLLKFVELEYLSH